MVTHQGETKSNTTDRTKAQHHQLVAIRKAVGTLAAGLGELSMNQDLPTEEKHQQDLILLPPTKLHAAPRDGPLEKDGAPVPLEEDLDDLSIVVVEETMQLSVEDEERFHQMFKLADKNNSGTIGAREMLIALRKNPELAMLLKLPSHIQQENGTREAFETVFQEMDEYHNREVDFEEFKTYLLHHDHSLNMATKKRLTSTQDNQERTASISMVTSLMLSDLATSLADKTHIQHDEKQEIEHQLNSIIQTLNAQVEQETSTNTNTDVELATTIHQLRQKLQHAKATNAEHQQRANEREIELNEHHAKAQSLAGELEKVQLEKKMLHDQSIEKTAAKMKAKENLEATIALLKQELVKATQTNAETLNEHQERTNELVLQLENAEKEKKTFRRQSLSNVQNAEMKLNTTIEQLKVQLQEAQTLGEEHKTTFEEKKLYLIEQEQKTMALAIQLEKAEAEKQLLEEESIQNIKNIENTLESTKAQFVNMEKQLIEKVNTLQAEHEQNLIVEVKKAKKDQELLLKSELEQEKKKHEKLMAIQLEETLNKTVSNVQIEHEQKLIMELNKVKQEHEKLLKEATLQVKSNVEQDANVQHEKKLIEEATKAKEKHDQILLEELNAAKELHRIQTNKEIEKATEEHERHLNEAFEQRMHEEVTNAKIEHEKHLIEELIKTKSEYTENLNEEVNKIQSQHESHEALLKEQIKELIEAHESSERHLNEAFEQRMNEEVTNAKIEHEKHLIEELIKTKSAYEENLNEEVNKIQSEHESHEALLKEQIKELVEAHESSERHLNEAFEQRINEEVTNAKIEHEKHLIEELIKTKSEYTENMNEEVNKIQSQHDSHEALLKEQIKELIEAHESSEEIRNDLVATTKENQSLSHKIEATSLKHLYAMSGLQQELDQKEQLLEKITSEKNRLSTELKEAVKHPSGAVVGNTKEIQTLKTRIQQLEKSNRKSNMRVGALDKQLAVFRERAKAEQEKKKKERNKKKAAARAAAIKRKADRQAAAGDAK